MNHTNHVDLLRPGIADVGGVWADFGAGSGAFTLALADLLGESAQIIAIDKDASALRENERAMRAQFPAAQVQYQIADFAQPLNLPPLDGIVMANSLHFHRQKNPILKAVHNYLKPGGRLLIVEYNTDSGNTWVPYPFAYPTWAKMATENGFTATRQLGIYPSRFLTGIYSALSFKSDK